MRKELARIAPPTHKEKAQASTLRDYTSPAAYETMLALLAWLRHCPPANEEKCWSHPCFEKPTLGLEGNARLDEAAASISPAWLPFLSLYIRFNSGLRHSWRCQACYSDMFPRHRRRCTGCYDDDTSLIIIMVIAAGDSGDA